MAQLTIIVPDANVTRIRAAFGTAGVPATIAQIAIKDMIRDRVVSFELFANVRQVTDAANAEVWP